LIVAEFKQKLPFHLKHKVGLDLSRWESVSQLKRVDPENEEFIKTLKQLAGKKYHGSIARGEALFLLLEWAGEDASRRKELLEIDKAANADESCHYICLKVAGDYGAASKALLPQIKKLKLANSDSVRKAADRAVEQIESSLEGDS